MIPAMIKGKVLVGFGDASADIYPRTPGSEVCACTKSIKAGRCRSTCLLLRFIVVWMVYEIGGGKRKR